MNEANIFLYSEHQWNNFYVEKAELVLGEGVLWTVY